jgi:hypothetical protein
MALSVCIAASALRRWRCASTYYADNDEDAIIMFLDDITAQVPHHDGSFRSLHSIPVRPQVSSNNIPIDQFCRALILSLEAMQGSSSIHQGHGPLRAINAKRQNA